MAKRRKKPSKPVDTKKYQRQIYVTKDLIAGLESLRRKREKEMRDQHGLHCDISWSQYVGSVLHEHVKAAKEAGDIQ